MSRVVGTVCAVLAATLVAAAARAEDRGPAKVMTPKELAREVRYAIVRIEATRVVEFDKTDEKGKPVADPATGTQSVGLAAEGSAGTGFVVEGGVIVTNAHVLRAKKAGRLKTLAVTGTFALDYADPASLVVRPGRTDALAGRPPEAFELDRNTLPLEVVNVDELSDLAVLRLAPSARFASPADLARFQKDLRRHALSFAPDTGYDVGDEVVAVGFALDQDGPASVTRGLISGLNRGINPKATDPFSGEQFTDLVQTDAAVNHGNSGGPLLNLRGQVVGVNTYSLGGEAPGLNFARSSRTAAPLVRMLQRPDGVRRPDLGLETIKLSRSDAVALDLAHGLLVTEVRPGSPADKAGVRFADVLTYVGGERVTRAGDLNNALAMAGGSGDVRLVVWRMPDADLTAIKAGDGPGLAERLAALGPAGGADRRGVKVLTLTAKVK